MSRPKNGGEEHSEPSTVIDVCLIGIRSELLAFLHRHSGGQTRIVRGRNSESQRGTLFGGDRRDIGRRGIFRNHVLAQKGLGTRLVPAQIVIDTYM